MPTNDTATEAGTLAVELFDQLTSGIGFTLPEVDLSDPQFQVGDLAEVEIPELSEASLTSREPQGSGMFDALMESLKAHLREEYEKDRITGAQYAEAYISMTGMALQNATQYLLGREQVKWQSVLLQRQAQTAALQVTAARVGLEATKADLATARVKAKAVEADYALSKLRLANEDANWLLAQSNLALSEIQTDKAQYELDYLLPVQKASLEGDVSTKTAQRDQILYETASILPVQRDKLDSEVAIQTYQLSHLFPAQVAGLTADTLSKTYNTEHILPAQLDSIKEQTETHRAKTLDTRSDGLAVEGTIGTQRELYAQQIVSYQRDAEHKAFKAMMDAWSVQRSTDEGLSAPSALDNSSINSIFNKYRNNLGL